MINNNCLLKIEFLLQKRDMFPWLMSLGFTQGMVNRIKKGQPASGELLRALQRTERVSLRWLIDDLGSPYYITHAVSDVNAVEQLLVLLKNGDWAVALATSDNMGFAAILYRNAQYEYKDKMIDYRQVEVVAGNVTRTTAHWLMAQNRGDYLLPLEPEEMAKLRDGHMGNMELFGWQDARKQSPGLWAKRQQFPGEFDDTNAYPASYGKGEVLMINENQDTVDLDRRAAEAELLSNYRQLTAEQREAIKAVLRSMIQST